MKVLLVANINSSHTRKWAMALKERGVSVGIFSLDPALSEYAWVSELDLVVSPEKKEKFLALKYYKLHKGLKHTIARFRPDLLHSHYLTNYAFLANYSGFQPHVSTAWGSDVYAFPKEGPLQKAIFIYNLKKASSLISTSRNMANEMQSYVKREVHIVPFGIDFDLFKSERRFPETGTKIHIACFKKIEKIYGHETLILAFQILKQRFPDLDLQLTIAGSGKMLNEIKTMASYLGVSSSIRFTGWVEPARVPDMMKNVDICVYLSKHESFGVSLLEAMASRIPMVVTRTPGFLEVVQDEKNALLVKVDDPIDAADKIGQLIMDPQLGRQLADSAYDRAKDQFELSRNIETQMKIYSQTLGKQQTV